jgi:hypothetical protein
VCVLNGDPSLTFITLVRSVVIGFFLPNQRNRLRNALRKVHMAAAGEAV